MTRKRKGAGKGKGKGYRNLPGFPKDPKVHSDSRKGIKQPQTIGFAYTIKSSKSKEFKRLEGDRFTAHTLDQECDFNNFLSRKFLYHPKCIVVRQGKHKVLKSSFKGKINDAPIRTLKTKHKKQIAEQVRYLFRSGHLLSDLKPTDIGIDSLDNAVILDFGGLAYFDSNNQLQQKLAEREYNSVILSIFGRKDSRVAKHFLTMKPSELF